MIKIATLLLILTLALPLVACVSVTGSEVSSGNVYGTSYINFKSNAITIYGSGAVVDDNQIAITSAGTYIVSGTLNDGQIIVNTDDQATVKLILDGMNITCSTGSPIYIKNADKTIITLADGTENFVTDGDSYIVKDSAIVDSSSIDPNAAIFSKDDLTINGNGSLTVNANYNNGIQSKDDLKISGGNITVQAVNDGIKGRDSITVSEGNITVDAGADGMQSNNDEDAEKGYISIESGTINITAGEDGIQAETSLIISGGKITVTTGGGSINGIKSTENRDNFQRDRGGENDTDTGSAKGLKAGVDITIRGGVINLDSADDTIHSNNSLTINGGSIILASGDDAMHSDSTLEINGGDISIMTCYEGIDSPVVTVNDGDIYLIANDDGINAASGVSGFQMMGQRGQDGQGVSGNNHLYINGGYIVIDAMGDGLDINGSIDMTGGVVIINGPTSDNNGALDYYGSFKVTGGFLIAVGSSAMAQAPSTSSTQHSVLLNLPSSQSAGTIVHIETEDGEEILTFKPIKLYRSVVLCSTELEDGSTYIVYCGGSSTGTVADGLYSGGTYTAGTQITSFTVSGIVTMSGSSGGDNRLPGRKGG